MEPLEPTRGILGFCLRLVKAVSRIVPEKWRGAWRQEWEAEIQHRWQKLQEWNRATWRNQMNLLKRTLGAISDAAWLRQQFTLDLDVMQDIRYGLRMLLGKGILLLLIGAGFGLAGAFAVSRYLESLLFNTTPTDPLTYAAVTLLLTAVALLACYIPARPLDYARDRRATKVDPMVALRYE